MTTINFSVTEKKGGGLVCNPEAAEVNNVDTKLQFTLTGEGAIDYMFTGYSSTDTKAQLGTAMISEDGLSMRVLDSNTQAETINITLQVQHRASGRHYYPDPQVQNKPPA